MVPKSKIGATKKYSNVVSSVKGAKPQVPQEPRITKDQVVEAFKSFGFPINDRGHNDILYWTSKGQSEAPKLIDELHKRRMDINKAEDEKKKATDSRNQALQDLHSKREIAQKELDHKKQIAEGELAHKQSMSKATMPRLSDQDLSALFDEYGLPPPDPEWARTHLPNDPEKVRSILEMQRKTADDMLKKHAKNSVNAIPEMPKMGGMPGMPPTPMMPSSGSGIGGPLGAQGDMTMGAGEPATPFFIGDHSLVRITNPTNPHASTTWLVDAKKKVLRPFMTQEAFQNAFEDPSEAEKAVVTISTKELGPGGALDGFKPLRGDMGVQHDGSMKNIPFTEAQLQNRYGKPADIAAEDKTMSVLDGLFGHMSGKASQG